MTKPHTSAPLDNGGNVAEEIEKECQIAFRKQHGFRKGHVVDSYTEFEQYEHGFRAGFEAGMKYSEKNFGVCLECGCETYQPCQNCKAHKEARS